MSGDVMRQMDKLRAHWERLGAATSARMRPGLSDDEIDHLTAFTGSRFNEDVLDLYRWADGLDVDPATGMDSEIVPGGWTFLPLSRLMERYGDSYLLLQADHHPVAQELRGWLPVFVNGGEYVLAEHPTHPPGRVLWLQWGGGAPPHSPTHVSLVSLLQTWVIWFDGGHVSYDPTTGHFVLDTGALHWTTRRSAFH